MSKWDIANYKRKPLPKALRVRVYKKYAGRCAYCGKQIKYEEMQVDHIKAVYLGGDNDFNNLLPACRSCNFYKSSYSIEEFRRQINLIPSRLPKEFIYKVALDYGIVEETGKDVVFYFEQHRAEDVTELDTNTN